ncbi:MAG TPA: PaaI family thioesterase [Candidatus Poseidoniaceae archaeon]|nr:MAG TPA: PaaI family thioesterase [Candidatus Poseidoniales archaeon]HII37740.1 PaaI family thioesterase [Candidatus Poseidoniaceae archaeon]
MAEKCVQQEYAPNSICFGCGPANTAGLQIESHRIDNGLIMEYLPNETHQAFPGMINGGIIGTLLDCHGNWTAAIALMDEKNLAEPPCTVTASYSVILRRPTPLGENLIVTSQINEIDGDKVKVDLLLEAGGKVCASGTGLFVAVKEGHPAYHRWN